MSFLDAEETQARYMWEFSKLRKQRANTQLLD